VGLTDEQIRRYARHILLPDVGGRGQERLLAASVTVEVGPGRDAEVAALAYLAAAGVGRLRLAGDASGPVTGDDIAGGILYGTSDLDRPRIDAVRDRVAAINPDVTVEPAAGGEPLAVPDRAPAGDVAAALIAGGGAAIRALAAITRGGP
jgi:adenylyltransferase/sulfurtransferase